MNERSIFMAALERASLPERSAYLDEACGGDAALRQRVEALLASHQHAGSFLGMPVPERLAESVATPDPLEKAGGDAPPTEDCPRQHPEGQRSRIGPYKLLQELGEGGMGTVWMAEQTQPVQRKVALKIIKPGMDSRQVIARFEAERQALALMDHPNIAKVLDGGTTESGRPYFVMELVKGVPITKYCDEHCLTPRQRLELFVPVCQAVQHAHQKGIIHRDLKPSNVLVCLYDGRPVPKVIDFGIAKATGQKLTERTMFTEIGQVVGTLEYMSPEQAEVNQLDIDTRSDIYSLGVLLYELLTGSTPLERKRLKSAAMLEVLRLIREEEPPRPSTRLSEAKDTLPAISAQRQTEPARLTKLVRGELDWIVMKALEKDRNRRYETANGFAMDIQRYLTDEPVLACPPSASYRLRKFARRYRAVLRVVAGFAAILVLAASASTWQAIRATLAEQGADAERRRANAERDRAEASFHMTREAVDRLFTQVSQSPKLKAQGMETFRKELLQTAREFHDRFVREQLDTPALRFDLGLAHRRLAEIDRELGELAAAGQSAVQAIAIMGELADAEPDVPDYRHELAVAHTVRGTVHADGARWDQAQAEYQEAVSIQEPLAGSHPDVTAYQYALAKTYAASGLAHTKSGSWNRTTARYRQALDVLDRLVGEHPGVSDYEALLAATWMRLGEAYIAAGEHKEAEEALKKAAGAFERLLSARPDAPPQDRASLARCHAILGRVYRDTTRPDKAEAAQQEALKVFEALARQHPDVVEFTYDVGRCHFALADTAASAGRLEKALTHYGKAIDILEEATSRGYRAAQRMVLAARIERGIVLARQGDHARASREAEALAPKVHGEDPALLYELSCTLAQSSAAAGHDAHLAAAERTRLQTHYANQAMDYLHQAVAKGWAQWHALENDPDIEPLRAREDFKHLLADKKAKTKR
jgi:serine/threonine protein kinase/tetratricopeptide (TPR) repeat protein